MCSTFKTYSLPLSAFLSSRGFEIQNILKDQDTQRCEIEFRAEGQDIHSAVREFNQGAAINARAYIDNFFNLRDRVRAVA